MVLVFWKSSYTWNSDHEDVITNKREDDVKGKKMIRMFYTKF
jgi:hypothetical protein